MPTNNIPDTTYGVEWAVLEMLCSGVTSLQEMDAIKALLLLEAFRWGEFLEQALRHKMLYIFVDYILSQDIIHLIPGSMDEFLIRTLRLNQHETMLLRVEAVRIIQRFQQASIPIVANKGIVFESTLYEGKGTRALGDIDFMVPGSYAPEVLHLMTELGYQQGEYKLVSKKIVPLDRQRQLLYKTSPDHLPHFIRLTDDSFVPTITVDFAFSFTWTQSEYQVPLEDAFQSVKPQSILGNPTAQLPVFSASYQFLFTILHFFREAWFVRHWQDSAGKDVSLIKCRDIILFWQNYPEVHTDVFLQLIKKYKLEDPIFWVLEHIDRTFKTAILNTFPIQHSLSEQWLSSTSVTANTGTLWRGTMRERLHQKSRLSLLSTMKDTSKGPFIHSEHTTKEEKG